MHPSPPEPPSLNSRRPSPFSPRAASQRRPFEVPGLESIHKVGIIALFLLFPFPFPGSGKGCLPNITCTCLTTLHLSMVLCLSFLCPEVLGCIAVGFVDMGVGGLLALVFGRCEVSSRICLLGNISANQIAGLYSIMERGREKNWR